MNVYADSSFIVPLYAEEVHSSEVEKRMASRPLVWLTPIQCIEVAHAFHFQAFRARISEAQALVIWQQFQQDRKHRLWLDIDLPERTWDRCIELARGYGPSLGIRTLDSLHVACALELNAEKFWTFDERQARLAQAVGLDTGA